MENNCSVILMFRVLAREIEAALPADLPGSNRTKYCPDCAVRMKRRHAAERKRKQRRRCHALGTEKAL